MTGWKLWDGPFFEERHRELAASLEDWPAGDHHAQEHDMANACRGIAKELARRDLLKFVVPERLPDGSYKKADVRAIALVREALGYTNGFADSVFAMQGIGTGAIWMSGSEELKARYLDPCRRGEKIAGFALTEPASGSDVASMTTNARREGDHYILNGEKTLITNGGFADHYVVVARTGEGEGSRGLTAFLVDADLPGLTCSANIDVIAPHPLTAVTFKDVKIPLTHVIGEPGNGFKVAMATFDIFRTSVGGAAIGMARRALDETLVHVTKRRLFGKLMAEMEGVQMKLADMACDTETAWMQVYRAAWVKDQGARGTREASMAKYVASEAAGRVVDTAVQLFGGAGVTKGHIIEHLYREVRPMRIYEGASEVQKLIIARQILAPFRK